MFLWMCSDTKKDKIKNKKFHVEVGIIPSKKRNEKIIYDSLVMSDINLQMYQFIKGAYRHRIN